MTLNKITASLIGVASVATLLLGALPAAAAQTSTSTATSTTTGGNHAAEVTALIAKGDTAITARIADLNKLNTRVQDMKNVSAAEKSAITTQVQTNITGLTALKAKLDADTVLATTRTDYDSIYGSFRIYALVIPQGYLLASADRITTIGQLMTDLGTKLQARIAADQAAGKNVSALTAAYTDLQAKIAAATAQVSVIKNGIMTLAPDQGNKTTAASNHAALVTARANVKSADTSFVAARADIKTILAGLKSIGGVGSTTSSTTTSH
jgi:hypothetical protein